MPNRKLDLFSNFKYNVKVDVKSEDEENLKQKDIPQAQDRLDVLKLIEEYEFIFFD